MTKSCATPAEAAEFMFYVMKADEAAKYAYGNGMLPGNLKGLDEEPFKSDPNWDTIRAYLSKPVAAPLFLAPGFRITLRVSGMTAAESSGSSVDVVLVSARSHRYL